MRASASIRLAVSITFGAVGADSGQLLRPR